MESKPNSAMSHTRIPRLFIPAVTSLFFLLLPIQALSAVSYSLIDLGPGVALDINNLGQVVGGTGGAKPDPYGDLSLANSSGSGFLWSSGQKKDLGTLGGNASVATAINDNGQIVGSSINSQGFEEGFRYRSNNLEGLGLKVKYSGRVPPVEGIQGPAFTPDYPFTRALDINDAGTIVGKGQSLLPRTLIHGNDAWEDPLIFGGSDSSANSINDKGQIAGWALGNVETPYILDGNLLTTIPINGHAMDINNATQVVGSRFEPGRPQEELGFYWDNGNLTLLDGMPLDLNDLGQAVGRNSEGAFLYDESQIINLNDLISIPDFFLEEAFAINELGQIVGSGFINDQRHAFLLDPLSGPVPAPEPATLLLFSVGFCGMALYKRRRKDRQD